MRRIVLSVCVLILAVCNSLEAQERVDFKPSGKIIARGFVNVNTDLGDNSEGVNFDVTRAYLGYQYKFTSNLQATVVGDFAAGKDENGRFVPVLKNAFLQWQKNKITLRGGLIGLYQFRTQESYWGHRYLYKSFQDKNKFAHSADVGVSVRYQIAAPLSVDFIVTNGQGYKRIQRNKSIRYQLDISLEPIDNLLLRLSTDYYKNTRGMHPENLPSYDIFDNQYTYGLFVGYKNDRVRAGLEYNRQINSQFNKDKNQSGYSAYCTVNLNKKWHSFVRFDMLESSKEQGETWNRRDGKVAILGAEYRPHRSVKIAPNFRYNRNDKTQENNYEVFINLEFRL